MVSNSLKSDVGGVTLWFTGLPCSGKSTIAQLLFERLRGSGLKVELLDGDVVRQKLTKGLGFSKEDRDENIRRIGYVCQLLSRNGVIAIGAAISPYRALRDELRGMIPCFVEIYLNCPLEVCVRAGREGHVQTRLGRGIEEFYGRVGPLRGTASPGTRLEHARGDSRAKRRKGLGLPAGPRLGNRTLRTGGCLGSIPI
jgi:adenylyl-sulfate kinase